MLSSIGGILIENISPNYILLCCKTVLKKQSFYAISTQLS